MSQDLADKVGRAAHGGATVDAALRISPLHPVFAAHAEGLDLSQPLPPADVAAIEAAMDRYPAPSLPPTFAPPHQIRARGGAPNQSRMGIMDTASTPCRSHVQTFQHTPYP